MREAIIKRLLQVAAVLILTLMMSMYANAQEYVDIDLDYKLLCKEAGEKYGVDEYLLEALIITESRGEADAVSQDGKNIGLCQLHKKYFKGDLTDPENNIYQAAEYLKKLEDDHQNIELALMIYHGEADAEKKFKNGKISYYAKNIIKTSKELRKMARGYGRINLDAESIYKRIVKGETAEDIAKEFDCGVTTIENRVKEFCLYNDLQVPPLNAWQKRKAEYGIADFGKVGALFRAGWSIEDIADEMHSTEEQVLVVLGKFRRGEIKMEQFLMRPVVEENAW